MSQISKSHQSYSAIEIIQQSDQSYRRDNKTLLELERKNMFTEAVFYPEQVKSKSET